MFPHDPVHHLADISKTSAAFGIFGCALTNSSFLIGHDFFHDPGLSVLKNIPFNVCISVSETVANLFVTHLFFSIIPHNKKKSAFHADMNI